MSEYETSCSPSNPVIATVQCAEAGEVKAGDVVAIVAPLERGKRDRDGGKIMTVGLKIKNDFQRVAGVVWANGTVSLGSKIAVAVAGGITIRSEGHADVRPGDYIVALKDNTFKRFDKSETYGSETIDGLYAAAYKKLDLTQSFVEWIQLPFKDDWLNDRYNRALKKMLKIDAEADIVPPNKITRLFGYNDKGKWGYIGKLDPVEFARDSGDIIGKNFTLGPEIDKLLYEGDLGARSGNPVWAKEENGEKLTDAFVEAGLEIHKIPSKIIREDFNKIKDSKVFDKVYKSKLWALMPTEDEKVMESIKDSSRSGADLEDQLKDVLPEPDSAAREVSVRPFAKCLEVGENVLRVLLIHNSP
jgi:hypothetical protein